MQAQTEVLCMKFGKTVNLLTHMIFHNSLNVCLFCSCAKTSIVIHQWFHAGWKVQHTVHKMTQGGRTCT